MGLSQQLKRLVTEDRELAVHFEDVIRQRHWAPVEVRDLINKYIDLAGLVDTRDKKYVRLNGPLTDAVFSGSKAPVGGYPDSMARPDLYAILLSKCTKYHRVVLYPGHEPKILGGPIRKIELLAEQSKKHRNSTVTTMAYYQQFGIDGATFAKEAQKKWGCSAALQASDDKSKGEEVKVQGQMINELCDYLATKYKIPAAKYVNVTYGKNVKPKKK
jgi:translation initiation factor 1 (eIF-1/SUI1)